MGKRSNNSTGFGTTLLRIVFVAALCLGVAYGWSIYRGKKPKLPQITFLQEQPAETNTISRPAALTNVAPRPTAKVEISRPQVSPPTNNLSITNPPLPEVEHQPRQVRNVATVLDAQIALARKGISVGTIDGTAGENMKRALLAYQIHSSLPVSGELDAETKAALLVEEPLFIDYAVSEDDLGRIMKVPESWLAKSKVDRLDFESILELIAEKGRASQPFIRKLNPKINWTNLTAGTLVKIPRIDPPPPTRAAFARVHLYSKTLNVFGKNTNLIAHFPCSIAAKVEKRPIGALQVVKAAANPTYLFDPAVFTESAEAKKIGRKLTIPAGPNNPVGTAWIGLSRPGYGIHGTPKPEQVGRTESHGCFRLANWNAEHLLQMSWAGMPVYVEP